VPSGAARARKITNAGNRKVIGKFPSLKMNRVIWWESQLERDYIYLLEIDPEVLSYSEQPFTISYTDKENILLVSKSMVGMNAGIAAFILGYMVKRGSILSRFVWT
jgi:hypothetical protein